MITQALNILIVEDSFTDAALLQRQILKICDNAQIQIVDELVKFRHALKTFVPDVVFTDFDLVSFTAEHVIENLNEIYPDTPVIIVTGTLNNDELVANIMLRGAQAFFLKDNISDLHTKLEPRLVHILEEKSRQLKKLRQERAKRDELEKVNSLLRLATIDSQGTYQGKSIEQLISQISTHIEAIIK